jgi:molecular chaperone GrpE
MTGKKFDSASKQLEECQKEKEQYLEGWQRAKADFVNYKKREKEENERQREEAREMLILKILPLLEDLERLEKASQEKVEWENLQVAINQISQKIKQFLNNEKISRIKSEGEEFDPRFHEAVKQEKSDQPKGIIIEEISPGYLYQDKLLRPAKVKVSG